MHALHGAAGGGVGLAVAARGAQRKAQVVPFVAGAQGGGFQLPLVCGLEALVGAGDGPCLRAIGQARAGR